MREIPCPRAPGPIIVDDADYDLIARYRWSYGRRWGYPSAAENGKTLKVHRLVMGARQGEHVDHVNGDKLDNRRVNLRLCTHQQNIFNRRRPKSLKGEKLSSSYKGVTRGRKRWQASIKVDRKSHFLGLFDTEIEAHHAYCEAARKYHGEFANFG